MHIINRLLSSPSRQLARRSLSLKANEPLRDSFGRRHDYLRVSLTERCNLRCRYCMPEEGVKLTDVKRCLSLGEIERLTSLLVNSCAITKIRLTGGEPTVDRKLLPILEHLESLRRVGLQTVAMTTNGLTLKSRARLYRDAARRMFSTSSNDNSDPSSGGAIEQAQFSHLNSAGRAKMVNVGAKDRVRRVAMAQGEICVGTIVLERLLEGTLSEKGDILTVAKVAGLMAAKSTSNLIPMCHHISLDHIQIDIEPHKEAGTLVVRAKVEAEHRTGVEMECLTAVSLTLLTIYDMCKSVGRSMTITNVGLVQKYKAAASAS